MIRPNAEGTLWIYVVYDKTTRDFPGRYVVRPHVTVLHNGTTLTLRIYRLYDTLDDARAACLDYGLTRLARHPDDDPVILETWL